MIKRAIIIVLDGFGVGELPDANKYGDVGSNTLLGIYNKAHPNLPNMKKLGLYNIDGININNKIEKSIGAYGKATETCEGKNSPVGHWEICGYVKKPGFKTYPQAFPKEIIDEFIKEAGINGILCNEVGSGTEILKRFGEEHIKTGYPIIYTSADSVFQIAAHEDVIPVEKLYEICKVARKILDNPKYNVGTVIARPFLGDKAENFVRTYNRRDFESATFGKTMLDVIIEEDKEADVIAIGKIEDLFVGRGITKAIHTNGNSDGIEKTIEYIKKDFKGLIFTNLVDFDMLYGHRNNVKGYSEALEYFDSKLPEIMSNLKDDDMLIITADHGNDPTTPSTDHSREYIPILIYGKQIKENVNIGTRKTYADISATILDLFNLSKLENGTSFKNEILVF
ncbi:MAG: phosphopentomutase [Clostridia bacterium]|nr:phosphopentomutase [Clostridia bacterium]